MTDIDKAGLIRRTRRYPDLKSRVDKEKDARMFVAVRRLVTQMVAVLLPDLTSASGTQLEVGAWVARFEFQMALVGAHSARVQQYVDVGSHF